MASAGFSAPVNFFYLNATVSAALSPVTSNENKTCSLAESANSFGDTTNCDSFGEVMAPSVDYIVIGELDLSNFSLGYIVNVPAVGKHFMIVGLTITTQAGQPPRVTVTGVEVEDTAVNLHLCNLSGTLLPRSKAQDICAAFAATNYLTQVTTTFSIDPHIATKAGAPKFSDASHARVEVSVTMTKPTSGVASLALGSNGFALSSPITSSNPDGDYITQTATAVKFLACTEPGDRSVNTLTSAPPSSGDGEGEGGDGNQR